MIRIKVLIFALCFALLGSPIAAIASDISNALYYGTVIISNNSTANTNVATVANISTQNLIAGGYLNSTANNTVMRNSSGADVAFMPGYTPSSAFWCMFVPSIGEDAYLTYLLYTDNSFGGDIRYFPAAGGMVISDNAPLELGILDFTLTVNNTFLRTDNGGNIINKNDSFRVQVDPVTDGVLNINSTGFNSNCLDFIQANLDYVRIPDNAAFSFTDGAGTDEPFTIIAWANFDDATQSYLFSKNQIAANQEEYWFGGDAGDLLTIRCIQGAGAGNDIFAQTAAITGDQGTWYHYAATYDGSEANTGFELYRDGVNITNNRGGAGVYVGMINGVAFPTIGANDNGLSHWFDGQGAEVKVYNAELTQAEILADYNGGHRTADLVAWWPIDEGDGLPQDSSGNGHHATVNLADWVETFDTRLVTQVSAVGVTSAEHDIEIIRDDEPAITSWANDVVIGVSMGQGILPVKILYEQVLSAPAATVTLSGITGNVSLWDSLAGTTSRHLVVLVNAASVAGVGSRTLELQFNGDSGANYNFENLRGYGGGTAAYSQANAVNIDIGYLVDTLIPNSYASGTILIPHAFNTSNHKTAIMLSGGMEDIVSAAVGRWADISAITDVTLIDAGGNFIASSSFILGVVDERYLVEEAINPAADFVVDFNGIAGTGHDLVVVGYSQSDLGAVEDEILHELNNDGGAAAYPVQELNGRAGAVAASQPAGDEIGITSGDNAAAEEFGAFFATYSQYAEATNQVHFTSLTGYHESTGPTTEVRVMSGRWANVAAITRLELYPNAGGNFKAGSLFSLYRVPRYVIDRQELTANAATITFANIPQNYQALQLNVYARGNVAALTDTVSIEINGDNADANFDNQAATGTGIVKAAARISGLAGSRVLMLIPAINEGANEFGGGVVTFYKAGSTDRHKHFLTESGTQENQVIIRSSRWENTAAITQIVLDLPGAQAFLPGSIFELVGIMPTKPLRIDIDGETKGISDGNADIRDDTSNWVIGSDATPYIHTYDHEINGVLRSDIEWEYGLIFVDGSGNGNPATPSFRTASADADIIGNMTAFTPISQAQAPAYALGPTNPFFTTAPNITGNFTIVPPVGTFPLAGVITAIANATATPPQLPLLLIACFVILAASMTTSYTLRKFGSGTLIAKAFVIIGLMGIFIALGDFGIDWWMLVNFSIIATALAMASRQQSWQ